MRAKHPPPIYRKPAMVPVDGTDVGDPDPLGATLNEWAGVLRAYLEVQGARLVEAIPADFPRGFTWAAIDTGIAQYRADAVPPGVTEAAAALYEIRRAREASGDARALAAFHLGATIERLRATEAFAQALESYRRSHALAVTDEQIREAVATHQKYAMAAAVLGISERQLFTRRRNLRLNRKPTTSDD